VIVFTQCIQDPLLVLLLDLPLLSVAVHLPLLLPGGHREHYIPVPRPYHPTPFFLNIILLAVILVRLVVLVSAVL